MIPENVQITKNKNSYGSIGITGYVNGVEIKLYFVNKDVYKYLCNPEYPEKNKSSLKLCELFLITNYMENYKLIKH